MKIRTWNDDCDSKHHNKAEMSLTRDEALRVIQSLVRQMRQDSSEENLLNEFLLAGNTEFRFFIVNKIPDVCGDCGHLLKECTCPTNGCFECGGDGVTCGCWPEDDHDTDKMCCICQRPYVNCGCDLTESKITQNKEFGQNET